LIPDEPQRKIRGDTQTNRKQGDFISLLDTKVTAENMIRLEGDTQTDREQDDLIIYARSYGKNRSLVFL
jgi:hypothetical protein